MDDKLRQAIGLFRHQVISPVLVESNRRQNEYFRELAKTPFEVPGQGRRYLKPSTMKGWLAKYRRSGFEGLMPKIRADQKQSRRLSSFQVHQILRLREEWPDINITQFYKKCLKENILGPQPVCEKTLRNLLKKHHAGVKNQPKARKRFETDHFGALWMADFMHGPKVGRKKAILFAMIDDYSRLIVGSGFSLNEGTISVERIFKQAVLQYGLPQRLYVDNGPAFSSQYLALACARLNVSLIHSKPYDSPSRGKIERFFRTVREGFLAPIKDRPDLTKLNHQWAIWLREEYHHKHHHGIHTRPMDRYRLSIGERPLKFISEDHIEEHFMATFTRKVRRDSTFSFNSIIYEAPSRLMGKKIEVRHPLDQPQRLFLYEDNVRVIQLKPVDLKANARTYRPSPREDKTTYQGVIKND